MTPSPVDLLWHHKLKRENGHILARMQKLESTTEVQASRLSSVESTVNAQTSEEVAALSAQVQIVQEGGAGVAQRIARVEQDLTAKLDDVQSEGEALGLQLASLEQREREAEAQRLRNLAANVEREKALLRRLSEVEGSLQVYEANLQRVGRSVDANTLKDVKAQLEGLNKQVRMEGGKMQRLEESVDALERTNEELIKANERLAGEMQRMTEEREKAAASRPTPVKAPAQQAKSGAQVQRASSPDESATPSERVPAKKSHKWAGGGADRDIITQALRASNAQTAAATRKKAALPKAQPVPAQRAKAAPAPKAKPPPPGRRTILQPSSQRPKPAPARQPVAETKPKAKPVTIKSEPVARLIRKPPPKNPSSIVEDGIEKPIIRAGKGWIEVANTPSQSEAEPAQTPKRAPGRPRRSMLSQADVDAAEAMQRTTRGGRTLGVPNVESRKRKRVSSPRMVKTKQAMKRARAEESDEGDEEDVAKEEGEEDDDDEYDEDSVFRSPASSPASQVENDRAQTVTSQPRAPQQPALKKRRVIEQGGDSSALARFSAGAFR